MRTDMDRVIIERPRGGARLKTPKGERRRRQRGRLDEAATREGVGRTWQGGVRKWQTDLLGPLRRFLRSRLGRPWDDVFSEICERTDRRSTMQDHLITHVRWEVETRARRIDGELTTPSGFRLWPGRLYVCPDTGRLREVRRRPKRFRRAR